MVEGVVCVQLSVKIQHFDTLNLLIWLITEESSISLNRFPYFLLSKSTLHPSNTSLCTESVFSAINTKLLFHLNKHSKKAIHPLRFIWKDTRWIIMPSWCHAYVEKKCDVSLWPQKGFLIEDVIVISGFKAVIRTTDDQPIWTSMWKRPVRWQHDRDRSMWLL